MGERLHRILEDRRGSFVSGEEIAVRMGISRAAVWKRVKTLRGDGYAIEGARGLGYRLKGTPDRLSEENIRAAVRQGTPWVSFAVLGETDSTNSRAMEMAENGAPHGTVVVAEAQTGGRGRLGRRWVSPPGKNVYVSLLLRPDVPPVGAPQLSLLAGVALADALEGMGMTAAVKWPNDLYLGDRKAAGILAEMASDPDRVRHVVIGVGINVNMEPDDFPPEISAKATSLRIRAGRPFPRVEVLARFLDSFAARYGEFLSGGFAAVSGDWDRRDFLRGRRVLLRRGVAERWGVAEGVDPEGALRFRPDGAARAEAVRSGEILEFGR